MSAAAGEDGQDAAARIAALEAELAEARRAAELQRALYEIAALPAAENLGAAHYARLHAAVNRLMDARNFVIALYDEKRGLIREEYLVDQNPDERMEVFPFGEGMSSLVIRSRRPWLLDQAAFHAHVAAGDIVAPRGSIDFHSWMGVPLLAEDTVYGLIIVQSYDPAVTYTPADLELLVFVAGHVANLIVRRRAHRALTQALDEVQQSAETLRMVGDIGKDLTAQLDVLAICRTLERHFAESMPCDAFGVALLSADGGHLHYVYYVEDGVVDTTNAFPMDHPTSLAVATLREDRELTLYNEARLDAAPDAQSLAPGAPILSAVFRPLIANGRRIGVVTVQSHQTDAYRPRHLEVFRSAAAFAAIALANADAYRAAETAREQAAQALAELRQAEAQLVHAEKMAALGQLIAGVAHEINTPIGAIKSSGQSIVGATESALSGMPKLLVRLDDGDRRRFFDLISRASRTRTVLSTREERAIVRELATRLEALGIAQARHRAGLLAQLQAQDGLDEVLPLLRHPEADAILDNAWGIATIVANADNINIAVDRVAKIVFALKAFSRSDGAEVWSTVDLRDGIETVLTLYRNQIRHGVDLVREFADDVPPVHCQPDELNQVWTNLVHNALQAMEHRGRLTIALRRAGGDAVAVAVGDTGRGIPEAIRARIFDPFFTTKAAGEGTGLGLDIVRKIVERHGGRIDVDSEVDRGTTFTVTLPVAGPNAASRDSG
ncbi:ATP-binding protein [Arenimonas composti]|uniref:histidine kinase n=1 Tax=Arenimonas composti TR7-09 = DSM 18010 TaxID=1121013 RepID=A0A091BFY5_9GAMM|nr:ATP-binding protein [Arenimonas composti]KFN50656.1 hypothetical protein P873_05710 [Arenimonas composti TR7-09 = DSM 18010]